MELLQGQFPTRQGVCAGWGQQKVIQPKNPALGKDWELKVPGGYCWVPVSVKYSLQASAQAGNRFAGFAFGNGPEVELAESHVITELEPSKEATYTFMREIGTTSGIKNANSSISMPAVVLEEGWAIGSSIIGIKSEDLTYGIVVWVEEFETMFDHTPDKVRQAAHEIDRAERTFAHG